jgi:phosphatidylethanolamine-binding protein (PEBP) family uncharacterized protein
MQARGTTTIVALMTAAALAGCGGSSGGGGASTTLSGVEPQNVAVTLASDAIHGGRLPALYTCDGRDVSPPLSWGAFPAGINEVALFVVGARRSKNGQALASIEWAMAGVKPGLRGLRAGEIPPGAFVLANSHGARRYSICPAKGSTKRYAFALYALPRTARASPAISGVQFLTNLTQTRVQADLSPAGGGFSVTYTRG